MTGYVSPDASATITYDAANRKTGEAVTIGGFTKSYSYAYGGRGNKSSFTTPEAITYNYSYNKNDQPTQITTPVGNIGLTYQWVRQTKVTLPNGIVTDYTYNKSNWLTEIKAASAALPPTFSAAYGFDKVGNITGKTTEVGAHVYGYDRLYQLTGATIPTLPQEAYSYDKVGNRKTSAQTEGIWSYNKNNELLSYNGAVLTYDLNGNTVTKSDNSAITTYNYGATDRLTSVDLPDGRTATYKYDPFGRRVSKQVGTQTTYFLYADEGLIGEYGADGSFNKGYGWRPNGIWGTAPVFMVESGAYYFYHNDHLGTPQKMTNVDGDVVWSATYGVFGSATVDMASIVTSNIRFSGQYLDGETDLHYNWNRYYDTKEGRYLAKDPIGLAGMDNNLFRYVDNSTVNRIDPWGLRSWSVDSVGASYGMSIIFGVSGQVITFVSNCEDRLRLKKSYFVVGAGIGLSVKITVAGNSSGRLGATTIRDTSPRFGFSVTGPSVAFLNYAGVGGVTVGSANLAFNGTGNSYSEVYAITTGPGLGASIFNFEGRFYIPITWLEGV